MDGALQVRAGRSDDVLRGTAGECLVEYRGVDGIVQADVFDATYAFVA